MKKSKVVIAIVLAIILVLLCVNVPTFSWFSRPQSQEGEKMMLNSKNAYTAYSGENVTIATYPSSNGFDYDPNPTASFIGSGIRPYNRNYFCTTITNSAGVAQDVSLYAQTLSIPTANNGTLALGVNGPTRSYRDYSSLATPYFETDRNVMRIYFEKDNSVTGWNGTEFYICWNESTDTSHATLGSKGENGTYYKLTHVGGNNNPNQYYADIPKTATHVFFCVANWGTNNNNSPDWGQRSQELINIASDGQSQTASKLYKITSNTNGSGNHLIHTPPYPVTGNCINHYYSSISLAVSNTFEAALSSGDYIGGSLEYWSGNENVFTVDRTSGRITAVGAGEATLYTKSTGGSYPDEQQVETTIKVTSASNYEYSDVPIVRNVLIPANDSVNVYWYVINNSDTTNLSYTIDSLYLGV